MRRNVSSNADYLKPHSTVGVRILAECRALYIYRQYFMINAIESFKYSTLKLVGTGEGYSTRRVQTIYFQNCILESFYTLEISEIIAIGKKAYS